MHPNPAATRHVRALAKAALALESGAGGAREAAADPVGIATEDVLFAVTRHRLGTLLAPVSTDLGMPAELVDALHELEAAHRLTLLAQQLELGAVRELLDRADVPALVIKGLPLAVQTTGNPASRGPGDIDLLVPPAEVPHVHQVLAAGGWTLRPDGRVSPGTWAWRHVLRNTCALTYVGPGSNIDLHWRLDTTVDALPDFDDLWSRRESVQIGGQPIDTLGRRDALAQSAFHAAKDRWRWLRSLVDLYRLADGLPEQEAALHRLELTTLAVTRATLGLPPSVPAPVHALLDAVPQRRVDRALRDQERPIVKGAATPGVESALNFRYLLSASTSARDLKRSVVATSLPVKVVNGIESRTAWTGVPVAIWRRAVRLQQRTLGRADGAGAPGEVVRAP